MIYINRNRNDENGNPIRPSEEWFETARVMTEVAIRENRNHNADRNAYAHNHVRAALEKLFYDKCAYCESKMTATDDWNVEHFRPKGRVHERQDHPGYYWLIYEWNNLYPVCTHCNQSRKDKPRWGDLRYASTGGKWDQFPLEDESSRAMSHQDDLSQERILLIDPCSDKPEPFLYYDITGDIHSSDDNLQGKTTIDICHLKRRRLKSRRRDIINSAVVMLKFLHKLETIGNNSAINEFKTILRDELLGDKCEHAGAARAVNNDPDAFGV